MIKVAVVGRVVSGAKSPVMVMVGISTLLLLVIRSGPMGAIGTSSLTNRLGAIKSYSTQCSRGTIDITRSVSNSNSNSNP